ncbi:hypothetical protein NPIL_504611 [Nephila pilipes]|uniref:Uncharacterized protein n=1 Tax=Nephila pilipes TaxID=299642 RepID=A0A8X6TFI1_NEPPI|nr:hypothetical protein NPIL_504611 [Nephila pilipes]
MYLFLRSTTRTQSCSLVAVATVNIPVNSGCFVRGSLRLLLPYGCTVIDDPTSISRRRILIGESLVDLERDMVPWKYFQRQIDNGDSPPIKQNPRRIPLSRRNQDEQMKNSSIIAEFSGNWASSIVLTKNRVASADQPCFAIYGTLSIFSGSEQF